VKADALRAYRSHTWNSVVIPLLLLLRFFHPPARPRLWNPAIYRGPHATLILGLRNASWQNRTGPSGQLCDVARFAAWRTIKMHNLLLLLLLLLLRCFLAIAPPRPKRKPQFSAHRRCEDPFFNSESSLPPPSSFAASMRSDAGILNSRDENAIVSFLLIAR